MHIKKTVYILMATYNGEKFLKEQIDSIINQSYKDWKLVIHDDGSSDRTNEILNFYKETRKNKIYIVNNNISFKNAGKNFLFLLNFISKESFDYIMFSDQDDVWLPDKIEKTLKKMMDLEKKYNNIPVAVHTDLKVVDEELKPISDSMVEYQKILISNQKNLLDLSIENCVTGCTMMINRQAFNLIQRYKGLCSDIIMYDWWLSLIILKSKGKIAFLNYPTVLYRQHLHNTIGAKNIGIAYYLNKFTTPLAAINRYKKIKQQASCLNIKIGIFLFAYKKFIFIIKKIKNFSTSKKSKSI